MYSSAKSMQSILTSREIRKTFIDYFICNHDHKFVRSSPVLPFCDPTVSFVNAGMNQFKSIFLGKTQPTHLRVANSQKCVRVGGKHNDFSIVGQDGYHHTFFEMLGNWSFGDYFKQDACKYALELLCGPYGVDRRRLYVTYFAGDVTLNLPPDMECVDIWRSLGIPTERILPFGVKDNFWEMGLTGPCGPCTEIHIDYINDGSTSAADRVKLVNAGQPDVVELWNLVFIQYNRNDDGTITKLPWNNVDTGMGFERLTAILQNKSSNYDTDLFTPLFDSIHLVSKAPRYTSEFSSVNNATSNLDTAYRILADHARMVTVCISDGMLPDQNQKLRRVLRRCFNISDNIFKSEHLLSHLVPVVVDILGEAYPEIATNEKLVLEMIKHEHEVYRDLMQRSSKAYASIELNSSGDDDVELAQLPGFASAYRDFQMLKPTFTDNIVPGAFVFKLSDTYGLTEDNCQRLAALFGMECDLKKYKHISDTAKLQTKLKFNSNNTNSQGTVDVLSNLTRHLPNTDNHAKYNYRYDCDTKSYIIPSLHTQITGMVLNATPVTEIFANKLKPTDQLHVVTAASNFYYESGGQQSDRGKLRINTGEGKLLELDVVDVFCLNNCVIHICKTDFQNNNNNNTEDNIQIGCGMNVELSVDAERRKMNICHHSATHLLNAAVKNLFKKVTYQTSSSVMDEQLKLEIGLIGQRLSKDDVQKIEDLIGRIICSNTPVEVHVTDADHVLQQDDITKVPGEIYPETGLRIIQMRCDDLDFLSKELCCGTHITNTQEIEYFSITNVKQINRARFAFTAVASTAAKNVLKAAALIKHRVDLLEEQFKNDKHTNATETEFQEIRNSIMHGKISLPYAFKVDTLERINEILRRIKESTRLNLKEFVEVEIKNVLQEKPPSSHPFILHYISSSALVKEVPLQKATRKCTDRPILVISMCDNVIKARCCVPQQFVSSQFNAELWLQEFAKVFNASVSAPRGQNVAEVCNMKGRKVSTQFEEQLENAMTRANEFAIKHLC